MPEGSHKVENIDLKKISRIVCVWKSNCIPCPACRLTVDEGKCYPQKPLTVAASHLTDVSLCGICFSACIKLISLGGKKPAKLNPCSLEYCTYNHLSTLQCGQYDVFYGHVVYWL